MMKVQRNQTTRKAQTDEPNLANIPAQAQLPPQRPPTADVCVPYQSSVPTGNEVIQCCGFGTWLREKLCCGDSQDVETPRHNISEPSRTDGPCVMTALRELGLSESRDEIIVQTKEFGILGHPLGSAAELGGLGPSLILFFRPGSDEAFHVMYTDGNGNLCGANNDTTMLKSKLCIIDEDFQVDTDKGVVKIPILYMTFSSSDRTTLKYISAAEYPTIKEFVKGIRDEKIPEMTENET